MDIFNAFWLFGETLQTPQRLVGTLRAQRGLFQEPESPQGLQIHRSMNTSPLWVLLCDPDMEAKDKRFTKREEVLSEPPTSSPQRYDSLAAPVTQRHVSSPENYPQSPFQQQTGGTRVTGFRAGGRRGGRRKQTTI